MIFRDVKTITTFSRSVHQGGNLERLLVLMCGIWMVKNQNFFTMRLSRSDKKKEDRHFCPLCNGFIARDSLNALKPHVLGHMMNENFLATLILLVNQHFSK
jgi:hypothetical protein